ncbi:hypothetical protein D9M71_722940 [compost metagenome]
MDGLPGGEVIQADALAAAQVDQFAGLQLKGEALGGIGLGTIAQHRIHRRQSLRRLA